MNFSKHMTRSGEYQNDELVDSNPVAYTIKKFVESIFKSYTNEAIENMSGNITLFKGSPLTLLRELVK